MLTNLKRRAVIARNYAVYCQYDFLAATAKRDFPLDNNSDFVISMASYPGRIHQVPAVYESLARQSVSPKAAYLVLSEEDFPNKKLPGRIKKLEARGVTIVWCKGNTFAVKKLVEIWGKNPGCAISTFDDDIIYSSDVLKTIKNSAKSRSNTVLGFIGKELFRKGNDLSMWFRESHPANEHSNPKRVYLQGGLGTWYQPDTLDSRFTNREAFTEIVPGRGSDIWFWAAAVSAGSDQVCLSSYSHSRMFIPIPQVKTTKPLDTPGTQILEDRFQKTIDYFGIREKLIRDFPDRS